MMFDPTPEQVEAATRAMEDYYDRWSGPGEQSPTYAEFAEVALVAAAGAAPQPSIDREELEAVIEEAMEESWGEATGYSNAPIVIGYAVTKHLGLDTVAVGTVAQGNQEHVEARLREVVYLCGDDLACDCEEARDGAEALARELSIVAAGEPALTEAKVWALAQALHDEAGDTDNVPAFVSSLADALRTAGIPFDEEPFVELGYLLPSSDHAPVQVDEAKLAKLIAEASVDYNLSDRSGESHACGAPDYRSAYVARAVAEWLRGGAQ